MVIKKITKTMKKRWQESAIIFSILIFAGIMTVFQPIDANTIGYFSDITTPLILIVGSILILIGVRKRSIV